MLGKEVERSLSAIVRLQRCSKRQHLAGLYLFGEVLLLAAPHNPPCCPFCEGPRPPHGYVEALIGFWTSWFKELLAR